VLTQGCQQGRSIALLAAAAFAEIAGAYLVWIGIREGKGLLPVALGVAALGIYGVLTALQPASDFGRVLAAYGGIFIAGSVAWAMSVDGFRPDDFDMAGVILCLLGAAVIMYAPR
jgi:small multidrug resistance family-3 protein